MFYFRKEYSTENVIISLTDIRIAKPKQYQLEILCGLSKAFDCVDNIILLEKLK